MPSFSVQVAAEAEALRDSAAIKRKRPKWSMASERSFFLLLFSFDLMICCRKMYYTIKLIIFPKYTD